MNSSATGDHKTFSYWSVIKMELPLHDITNYHDFQNRM